MFPVMIRNVHRVLWTLCVDGYLQSNTKAAETSQHPTCGKSISVPIHVIIIFVLVEDSSRMMTRKRMLLDQAPGCKSSSSHVGAWASTLTCSLAAREVAYPMLSTSSNSISLLNSFLISVSLQITMLSLKFTNSLRTTTRKGSGVSLSQ